MESESKSSNDNRSRQLNPEHATYWRARGHADRPAGPKGGK